MRRTILQTYEHPKAVITYQLRELQSSQTLSKRSSKIHFILTPGNTTRKGMHTRVQCTHMWGNPPPDSYTVKVKQNIALQPVQLPGSSQVKVLPSLSYPSTTLKPRANYSPSSYGGFLVLSLAQGFTES